MNQTDRFFQAFRLLPESLRRELVFIDDAQKRETEEIRLRCGLPVSLTVGGGVKEQHTRPVCAEDLEFVVEQASQYSLYATKESMKHGFLTAQGGVRIGIGGSILEQNGEAAGYRTISSLNLRIPHAAACVDDAMFRQLADGSVLIYSLPGTGKTTVLRELVRRLSDSGKRISLLDERGELAALQNGIPLYDVGKNTDVLAFCAKQTGTEMLLRSMNPQVIAMDELSASDAGLLDRVCTAGVMVLATVHAENRDQLRKRGIPLRFFPHLLHIRLRDGVRHYTVEEGEGC